jgi:hypothetical protein
MKAVVRVATMVGVAALAIILIGLFWYTPTYDRGDPDYHRFSPIFAELEGGIEQHPSTERAIDLSQLNGGSWKTACLFGYTDPLQTMQKLGATIDAKDETRLTEARSRGFRAAQVEEFEMMIAYIDLANRAHFVHFERGLGAEGQHLEQCVSKPATSMILPPG